MQRSSRIIFEIDDLAEQEIVYRERELAIFRAELALEKNMPAFLSEALRDVEEMTNTCAKALNSDAPILDEAEHCKGKIQVKAGHLMEVCQSYGFGYAGQISTSLYDMLDRAAKMNSGLIRATESHLMMLDTVFSESIKGDGGETGEAILKALRHAGKHSED